MKTFSVSLCLIFLINSSYAQKVYFKASAGYGLPVATQSIGQNTVWNFDQYTQESTATLENVSGSFGAGPNFNIGGGYMFSKYLGIDLNFQYLSGKKYKMMQTEHITGPSFSESEMITKVQANAIHINPSLVITPGVGRMLPYGRFGVVISSPKVKGEQSLYHRDVDDEDFEEREWKYNKGTAFGFQGAVGFNFAINNSLDIYAEVNYIGMTYYPKEYEITKFIKNGDDQLEDMTVRQKKTEFKKEINLNDATSQDEPDQELRVGLPFSSISLQVGIKFILGGRATE